MKTKKMNRLVKNTLLISFMFVMIIQFNTCEMKFNFINSSVVP